MQRVAHKPKSLAVWVAAAAVVGMLPLASECEGASAGLDHLAATTQAAIAAPEPHQGETLTAEQEEALALRFKTLERAQRIEVGNCYGHEDVLGQGRCRDLNRALFDYNLHSQAFGRDLWVDPGVLEDPADTVLNAYAKLQREALENAIGLEAWWDRKRDARRGEKARKKERPRAERSYRTRVSPRISDDYVGVKLRMPYTGSKMVERMSFQMRYDTDESRPVFFLKFDDYNRYWQFAYEPDTEEFGDQMSLAFRFSW